MEENESKIPEFDSLEEEAEFWEDHSIIDYLDEFEELDNVIYEKPERQVISLRLETEMVDKIRSYAQEIGIPYTALMRMWIINSFKRDVPRKANSREKERKKTSSTS